MIFFETERLLVRALQEADFPHIFRLQSDAETMRYIRAPVTSEQEVHDRIDMWEKYRQQCPGMGVFVLEIRENGAFAGYVTARHVEFKPENDEFEVGYVVAPEWHRRGLAGEMLPLLCQYLFERSGAPEIVAFTHPDNLVSQRVLLQAGFRETGARENLYDGPSREFRLQKV